MKPEGVAPVSWVVAAGAPQPLSSMFNFALRSRGCAARPATSSSRSFRIGGAPSAAAFDLADPETFPQPEPRSALERVIVIGALLVVGPLVLLALLFVIAVLSQLWQLLKLICADLC